MLQNTKENSSTTSTCLNTDEMNKQYANSHLGSPNQQEDLHNFVSIKGKQGFLP